MLESEFQNKLIQELKRMFKGCIVTKLDASHIQGIPDLLNCQDADKCEGRL